MLCLFGSLFDDPPRRKPNESPGEIIKPLSFSKRKRKEGASSEANPKHNSFSLCEKVIFPSKLNTFLVYSLKILNHKYTAGFGIIIPISLITSSLQLKPKSIFKPAVI